MAKRLAAYVTDHETGKTYGPDDDVPSDVAKRITNESAWAEGGDDEDEEPVATTPTPAPTEVDGPKDYKSLDVSELKNLVAQRNANRGEDEIVKADGRSKNDMVAALEADDHRNDA